MDENVTDGFTLASASIEPVESYDEEIDIINQADKQDIKNAFVSYIGSENYKSVFELYENKLKYLSPTEVRSIAITILKKIEDIYGYKFFDKFDLSEKESFYIFDFIAFLEFKHIRFFAQIWKELEVNILQIDISSYCFENKEHITNIIDTNISGFLFSKYIVNFLQDTPVDLLINFFIQKSIERKAAIAVEILTLSQEIEK